MTTHLTAAAEAATDPSPADAPKTTGSHLPAPNRREVLLAAGLGAGALALAACGSSSTPAASTSTTATSATSAAAGSAGGAAPGGNALVAVSKVPVGGAVAATDANGKPIVVAQPSAGKVVAFSAICTHMGCTVAVAGTELDCPCHGSKYNALTGAVVNGPASKPLPSVAVEISGGNVVAG
ncbi:Rieske Fe-S protein [Nakamurella panacisegetis]|uniref:Cytochrome bc1 complex Rieske iron-sulfur subunit n=1 Tax=Nakamurella panacisegetis TaxID=1090615 RepID=A0A1H0NYM2_9ACTN|nr:Rieske (2Fe-2S) protein [Nakamurella panacisegetis]SDO97500.1 Rieske Fe-S protein [Nakamurella panacisegetis]